MSNCHLCNKQTLLWGNVNVYKARILLHCNQSLGCVPLLRPLLGVLGPVALACFHRLERRRLYYIASMILWTSM